MAYDRHYTNPPSPPSSFKKKLRSSICFSCCFRGSDVETLDSPDDRRTPSLLRSSSTWIRSKAQELPELKEKCRGLISRISKSGRHQSSDFRYDPLSYALNFDEGAEDEALAADEFRYRNFSSRLPASPPPPASEIACN